ncbi:MAG: SdpI family protein [archaeon]|jgi:uncharacterized membrane protein|nr:SdpI family protein [archaeon]
MKKYFVLMAIVLIAMFAISAYVYPLMPERIASHWNAAGNANGFMDKDIGLFLIPLVSLALLSFFAIIPKIDPLKKNIVKFKKQYTQFILLILLFLLYIQFLIILWNTGKRFDFSQVIAPGVGALLYFMGVLLPDIKRNWFIGIRTPWTLSSDAVWDKTHALGGKVFKAVGVIVILAIFIPAFSLALMIWPILIAVVYLLAFSYFEFKKQK